MSTTGGASRPRSSFKLAGGRGLIRQIVQTEGEVPRRYLVIAPGTPTQIGAPVQVQMA